jgi:tetratricopeptide (TPR) repeat protein
MKLGGMHMKHLTLAGLFVAALLATSTVAHAEVITLKDGRVMHVKLVSADELGVTVERFDNDGKLKIAWDLLRDEDKKRLRVHFGLEEEELEAELLMPGQRIYPKQSDYVDGLIEKEDQETIAFRVRGTVGTYRRDALRKPAEDRDVSVFEVYTPEQLYEKRVQELGDIDGDANALFELAKYAAKITMYDKAILHYLRVKELDPELKAEYVANQLKRLEALDQDKVTRKLMDQANQLGYQNRYDDCLAVLKDIVAAPTVQKDVKAEATKAQAKWEKKRWDYFTQQVKQLYLRRTRQVIEDLSHDKRIYSVEEKEQLTIDKAMSILRSQLHKETIEHLAQKLKLDPKKEVEKMWKERKPTQGNPVSYGSGTFIINGVKDGAQNQGGGGDELANRVRELINRVNRNSQQQPQQSQEAAPELVTKEKWWAQATSTERLYWMLAYFAENSGQFEIVRRALTPCERCGATGALREMGAQGAAVRVTCPRCQGNKGDTVLYYK